jgi:molybdenum cofactor synthesis domain-containing protein
VGALTDLPAGSRATVITVSDRSYAGVRPDTSGPLLATLLADLGFAVAPVVLVPDEASAVASAVRAAVADADLVVTTGGTGLSPRDVTPEAVGPLLERLVPGLAEALRLDNREAIPTSVLSRGVAGTIDRTLVVTLPGSIGGVRDGVAVLAPVVGHALAQLRGGDH